MGRKEESPVSGENSTPLCGGLYEYLFRFKKKFSPRGCVAA